MTTHSEAAAKALAALAVEVEGPATTATEAFFLTLFHLMENVLTYRGKQLNDAELSVVGERSDDVELRLLRDTTEAQLRGMLVRMRSSVMDSQGSEGLKTYGFEPAVPDKGYELASYGEKASHLMMQKPFSISADGVTYDGAAMAQALDAKSKTYRQTLVDMERESQELVNELGKRDALVAKWADGYQGIADMATGLYRLVGLKYLAERVRPTARTLSGEEVAPEMDENAPGGANEPPATGEATGG